MFVLLSGYLIFVFFCGGPRAVHRAENNHLQRASGGCGSTLFCLRYIAMLLTPFILSAVRRGQRRATDRPLSSSRRAYIYLLCHILRSV